MRVRRRHCGNIILSAARVRVLRPPTESCFCRPTRLCAIYACVGRETTQFRGVRVRRRRGGRPIPSIGGYRAGVCPNRGHRAAPLCFFYNLLHKRNAVTVPASPTVQVFLQFLLQKPAALDIAHPNLESGIDSGKRGPEREDKRQKKLMKRKGEQRNTQEQGDGEDKHSGQECDELQLVGQRLPTTPAQQPPHARQIS